MRFVLHRAALDATDAGLRRLDTLIDRCEAGIHRLESPDADLLEGSHWYQGARTSRRSFLQEALALPPRKHNPGEPHHRTHTVATPQDINGAANLSVTPLTILVENQRSDGAFLRVLIEECGPQALIDLLQTQEQPPALQIDSAGGLGEIPALLQEPHARRFVLFDGDARWPGDEGAHPKQREEAVRACQDTSPQTPHHVWRKRCVENYIPDAVIRALYADPNYTSAHPRLTAILARTALQRDHMPMKGPLSATERREATTATLYDEARDGAALDLFQQRAPLLQSLPDLLAQQRAHFTREASSRATALTRSPICFMPSQRSSDDEPERNTRNLPSGHLPL